MTETLLPSPHPPGRPAPGPAAPRCPVRHTLDLPAVVWSPENIMPRPTVRPRRPTDDQPRPRPADSALHRNGEGVGFLTSRATDRRRQPGARPAAPASARAPVRGLA